MLIHYVNIASVKSIATCNSYDLAYRLVPGRTSVAQKLCICKVHALLLYLIFHLF